MTMTECVLSGWAGWKGRITPGLAAFGVAIALFVSTPQVCAAVAGVVISEIHYHPVEEPEFDAAGAPKLDLSNDVHEFVELQNPGSTAVDLSGWRLTGGISFKFPAGSTLAPGEFRVVARSPERFAAVYGLDASRVLGPYDGYLGNSKDTVNLANAQGTVIDTVSYQSTFPWPTAPDGLGDGDRFTGLKSADHQYKGRSLQRVSATWSGNDPANWLASPLTGPTPGGAQSVTRGVPKPVVIAQSAVPVGGDSKIPRPGVDVTISCTFSDSTALSEVTLEWFVDDINAYGEKRTQVSMVLLGSGRYTAVIPGQASRSVVRYRILANRGDGVELISPRADDAPISPVGVNGALESWHGYFVTPVRSSTNAAVYDVLVSATSLSAMARNISQSPNRVTAASATGVPRDERYVAATAPQWNGTVPGIFACNGELWDIHIRYHGSKYHRAASNFSYKLHFPGSHPLNGQASWFETLHGAEFVEAQKLNRLVGLPASRMRFVDWYLNANANNVHTEQGEYADDMLDEYHAIQQTLNGSTVKESNGELYKDVGNRDASQNSVEGPYTRGDSAPLAANAGWTQLQRYEWTFAIQNHTWKGSRPIRDLIEGMWAARGDTPSTHNFSNDPAKLAATRAWFTNNWDIDTTITSMALLEWMSIWDDAAQNHFFWRRANGKWSRLGWDYDGVMSTSTGGGGGPGGGPGGGGPGGGGGGGIGGSATQTIYGGEQGATTVFDGVNWWKDTFYKCFRAEYQKRLWELNNSVLDPANLAALGFSRAVTFAKSRQTYVNTQLSTLGTYAKPDRPTHVYPANAGAVSLSTNLVASNFSHATGAKHASTLWEMRTQSGDYENPLLHALSTESLTQYALPIKKLEPGQTYFWRVTYFDAEGHASVISAETSFTWGAAVSPGESVLLGEVLAYNRRTVANGGGYPDYVELHNAGSTDVSLNGYSLSDDLLNPSKYLFPTDATIPAGGYRIVWCDNETEAPGLHAGFGLNADGDSVWLFHAGKLVDSVEFGPQAPDISIGRIPESGGTWQANRPTPGTVNTAITLGSALGLRVNEWMANPAYGEDWFEIYNSGDSTVSLAGLHLSDSPTSPAITKIPALSFIAPHGFARFQADGNKSGRNHVNFKLNSSGDTLVLTDADGVGALDLVKFGAQKFDVSEGRLPDGAGAFTGFTQQTASPGEPNWTPSTVVVSEVLAHGVSPLENAVELRNSSNLAVNVGGWWLSDDILSPRKFQIPAATVIPAGGYAVFYANQFAQGAQPFGLNPRGGEVVLTEIDATGASIGKASVLRFGASPENVSFGRVEATGLGADSAGATTVLLSKTSFGRDDAATVELFRGGVGAENARVYLSPVLFSEVHYHPTDTATGDDTAGEFLEVFNASAASQDLSGWRVRGDSDFTFPIGTQLASGARALLVSFDPAHSVDLAAFRSRYQLGAGIAVYGPLSKPLPNSTANLELVYPITIDGQRSYVVLDQLNYRDVAPWDLGADGNGLSLNRSSEDEVGSTAKNWVGAAPSPGGAGSSVAPKLSVAGYADGVVTLRLTQGPIGAYSVESSTNLVNWTALDSVTVATIPQEWTVKAETTLRFYRVRRQP